MLYECLKILHVSSASALTASLAYSFYLWRHLRSPRDGAIRLRAIQTLTFFLIMPLAILQLLSGCAMISVQRIDTTQLWISGSFAGFIVLVASWFGFLYFLLLAQQMAKSMPAGDQRSASAQAVYYRRWQALLLAICLLALLSMVFLMANKVK